MMNTKIYNENDIEILENGISVDETFFSKKEIADTFNELLFVRNIADKITKKSN